MYFMLDQAFPQIKPLQQSPKSPTEKVREQPKHSLWSRHRKETKREQAPTSAIKQHYKFCVKCHSVVVSQALFLFVLGVA